MSKYSENKFQEQGLRKNLVSKMYYIAYIWSDQSAYSDWKTSSQLNLQLCQEIKNKISSKVPLQKTTWNQRPALPHAYHV